MEFDLPDAWPPSEEDLLGTPVVPLFPLPGVFLFPRQLMPLHIFEPRYRQMIEDCLDGRGWIVIGNIPEGYQQDEQGNPRVSAVAGLGEITRHERLKDGRFLIWLFGLTRVRLQEVPSERLYRRVRIQPLLESATPGPYAQRMREAIIAAIRECSTPEVDLPTGVPLGVLVDVLIRQLELPPSTLDRLFSETDAVRRAELALAAR